MPGKMARKVRYANYGRRGYSARPRDCIWQKVSPLLGFVGMDGRATLKSKIFAVAPMMDWGK
jgi:hypothetical protein